MKLRTHEDFTRQIEHAGPSDRSFALTFSVVFALLSLAPLLHRRPVRLWASGVAAAFLILAIARPSVLHGANRAWMRLGALMSRVVSPIVMGLMFYLIITPMAFALRLFGADLLRLEFDRKNPTYWIDRVPPGPSPESMSQQF